jgi:spore coat protein CotH
MSKSKHTTLFCSIIAALTLAFTILLCFAKSAGAIGTIERTFSYESKIFDTSYVHSIDIVMDSDDWQSFIENAESEEYALCSLVIDGETISNCAIRAKGNTSLSNVKQYGNNRYSFKVEFDHYDDALNYYGLDKLVLNNNIQDNTLMKDYLTYRMMAYMGVDAPLVSYVYVTVNGEDFGLYLAVEGVEESFLERNYGTDYGELYKPDSQSMGGGRGNGKDFDMQNFADENGFNFDFDENMSTGDGSGTTSMDDSAATDGTTSTDTATPPAKPDGDGSDNSASSSDSSSGTGGSTPPSMPSGGFGGNGGGMGGNPPSMPGSSDSGSSSGSDSSSGDDSGSSSGSFPDMSGFDPSNMGDFDPSSMGDMDFGGGGFDSDDDVSLIYTDDEFSSYSNIFDSAKTALSTADKKRLISSLKKLNENEDIEDVVNVEQVIRYFVVHNFVCNFDSYTGSMIHNYYLYEEDGKLSMIPWDYNLAFGGFMGGDATTMVNYPIDTPVSGGSVESRPMLSWIFESEEYTELYHSIMQEFITSFFDSGEFESLIDETYALIAPYAERDTTGFCTYEEFEAGVSTLKEFCLLRAQSVQGQLDGTIPSTSSGQNEDSSSLVDASDMLLSTMGSFGGGGGGGNFGGEYIGRKDN